VIVDTWESTRLNAKLSAAVGLSHKLVEFHGATTLPFNFQSSKNTMLISCEASNCSNKFIQLIKTFFLFISGS